MQKKHAPRRIGACLSCKWMRERLGHSRLSRIQEPLGRLAYWSEVRCRSKVSAELPAVSSMPLHPAPTNKCGAAASGIHRRHENQPYPSSDFIASETFLRILESDPTAKTSSDSTSVRDRPNWHKASAVSKIGWWRPSVSDLRWAVASSICCRETLDTMTGFNDAARTGLG